jgi:hypothetical protein
MNATRIVVGALGAILVHTAVAAAEIGGPNVIVTPLAQVAAPGDMNVPMVRSATRSFPEAIGTVIVGVICSYRYWRRGRVI